VVSWPLHSRWAALRALCSGALGHAIRAMGLDSPTLALTPVVPLI
jgi:hypothetical protein